MLKSKTIDLLRSFTKKELRLFEDFLNSPFHNSNNRIVQVFKLLKKFYPEFDNENLSNEYLFGHLYKGKKYNSALVRNILSDLLKEEEKFLAHYELKKEKPEIIRLMNKYLVDKDLYNYFGKTIKEAFDILENSHKKNERYLYYKYVYMLQNMMIKRQNEHEYTDISADFLETEKALAEYTGSLAGSYYMTYITLDYVPMEKLKPVFYEHTMKILSDPIISSEPAIKIYFLFHKLYETGSEEYYFKSKEHLYKYEGLFEHEEIQNFYIPLHNYVLNKINSGNPVYLAEYLEIINKFFEKGFGRNKHGFVSQPLFRNAVMTNVKLGRYNDARNFVEKFNKELLPESQLNNYYYSMAYIFFHEKKFHESMNYLAKIKYDEYMLKMQTESLALQNCYELNMTEEGFYKIDAFEHYIHNNKKIPGDYVKLYSNFLKYLKKILRLKNGGKPAEAGLLKKEILRTHAASGSWLLEKLDELAKEKKRPF